MSDPIKNDGRDRVPKVVKIKVKVAREGGEEELPYIITLTLDEVGNSFDYDVQLRFSNENYDIPSTSMEPSQFPMPSPKVLYKVETNYRFPQNEPSLTVVLIYPGESPGLIEFKTYENVTYEYEGV